jgi:hypothetical protein
MLEAGEVYENERTGGEFTVSSDTAELNGISVFLNEEKTMQRYDFIQKRVNDNNAIYTPDTKRVAKKQAEPEIDEVETTVKPASKSVDKTADFDPFDESLKTPVAKPAKV